jgi:hypothetical protein
MTCRSGNVFAIEYPPRADFAKIYSAEHGRNYTQASPSTALSQEHEVGETKRSCRSCVCDEQFWTSNQHRYDGKGLGC